MFSLGSLSCFWSVMFFFGLVFPLFLRLVLRCLFGLCWAIVLSFVRLSYSGIFGSLGVFGPSVFFPLLLLVGFCNALWPFLLCVFLRLYRFAGSLFFVVFFVLVLGVWSVVFCLSGSIEAWFLCVVWLVFLVCFALSFILLVCGLCCVLLFFVFWWLYFFFLRSSLVVATPVVFFVFWLFPASLS